jgi:uncharacterized pyridoxamine 5'-phosphate oxidase family protein
MPIRKKKMYKKIEKSSKICLCMIKKTSSHIHIKKIPQKIVPLKQKKKEKRAENHTLKQLVKEREKNQIKNKITGL